MALFGSSKTINLQLQDAEIDYIPQFINEEDAVLLFKELMLNTPWQEDDIRVYGKLYKQPRLTAFFANNQKSYGYANITMTPHDFTPVLKTLKHKIEAATNTAFTSCLLNLYRDGQDSNGWHADDEKELVMNPVIASLSFGASRTFQMQHRFQKSIPKQSIALNDASLLVMQGETQHYWKHQIPKQKNKGPRINLTFRKIIY